VPPPSLAGQITVYSGRSQNLVGSLLQRFETLTGVEIKVRYGATAEMAALILEEGENSPCDVYYAQDAGALGALAAAGRLRPLPPSILSKVQPRFRSPEGLWVGSSGRARVVAYSTERVREADLYDSIWSYTDPKWTGRIGWAPTNGSFQAFVTAMRLTAGDQATAEWLKGILRNRPKTYANNAAIVAAIADGEIDLGFVNHYYLFNFLAERGESFPVRNFYPRAGDPGSLINVAGAAVLKTSRNPAAAEALVDFLLSPEAQASFAEETHEYPLIPGVPLDPRLRSLDEIATPDVDLGALADLEGTLNLLREVGALE